MTKPSKSQLVLRIIGLNHMGGARYYAYQLNSGLEAAGYRTYTFLPPPPTLDIYSSADLTAPLFYSNSINFFRILFFILTHYSVLAYVHLHLNNIIIPYSFVLSLLRVRFVVTYHQPVPSRLNLRQKIIYALLSFSYAMSSRNIFISNYTKEKYFALGISRFKHLRSAFEIIHNGSTPSIAARERTNNMIQPTPKFIIVLVGELTQRKNIHLLPSLIYLIQSLHNPDLHPPISINVYGRGPLQSSIHELTSNLSQEPYISILSKGYTADHQSIFEEASLHLILSKNEPFGRVVTEAMSFGIPTICFAAGAFPELIVDGSNGFLCSTLFDMADRIIQLLERPGLRDSMQRACYSIHAGRFTEAQFISNSIKYLS